MRSKFIGWICRGWIETTRGWVSTIIKVATEQDALDCGYEFVKNISSNELAREFEIYKDYELVKEA